MGEYTPNLNLYKPKADFPAERGWGTKYNEAMDIIDGCAKKAYVDGLIAGLKLSQIAIDSDKDWNKKSITNVNSITTTSLTVTDLVVNKYILNPDSKVFTRFNKSQSAGSGATVSCSIIVPSKYVSGSSIKIVTGVGNSGAGDNSGTFTCYINGVSQKSYTQYCDQTNEFNMNIKGGDVLRFDVTNHYKYAGTFSVTGYGSDMIYVPDINTSWS